MDESYSESLIQSHLSWSSVYTQWNFQGNYITDDPQKWLRDYLLILRRLHVVFFLTTLIFSSILWAQILICSLFWVIHLTSTMVDCPAINFRERLNQLKDPSKKCRFLFQLRDCKMDDKLCALIGGGWVFFLECILMLPQLSSFGGTKQIMHRAGT